MAFLTPLRLIFAITSTSVVLGALYGCLEYQPATNAAIVATALHGAAIGGVIAALLSSAEIYILRHVERIERRRLPFSLYLGLRSLFYLGVILAGLSAINRLLPTTTGQTIAVTRVDVAFSLALSLIFNLQVGLNDLLGPGVLFAFVAGRYNRPSLEHRALLFIDMRGSTAIAERLGEIRFLDFLNRFMMDVSLAIAEAGGEVHKYVGDEIIATWRLAPHAKDSRAVQACFAAFDRLDANRASYEREFGERADFRAGLHFGPVVVGELGFLKKEIALLGDSMNTAARIQEACRQLQCRVLASAALMERIGALPEGVEPRAMGLLRLRGKAQAIELFALEREPASPSESIGARPVTQNHET